MATLEYVSYTVNMCLGVLMATLIYVSYTVNMCLGVLIAKSDCATNIAVGWFRYNDTKLNSQQC